MSSWTNRIRNVTGSRKGDKNRTTDWKAYRENYDRIFGKQKPDRAAEEAQEDAQDGQEG